MSTWLVDIEMPLGYCLGYDLERAPRWLRLWLRFPMFNTRPEFVALDRGALILIPLPDWEGRRGAVPEGWRVEDGIARSLRRRSA